MKSLYPEDRGGGPANPRADEACGAVDYEVKFPTLVHFDCRECRDIVRRHLLYRVPTLARPLIPPPTQPPLFDDLAPKRARRD